MQDTAPASSMPADAFDAAGAVFRDDGVTGSNPVFLQDAAVETTVGGLDEEDDDDDEEEEEEELRKCGNFSRSGSLDSDSDEELRRCR